jgi:hypothetical protein
MASLAHAWLMPWCRRLKRGRSPAGPRRQLPDLPPLSCRRTSRARRSPAACSPSRGPSTRPCHHLHRRQRQVGRDSGVDDAGASVERRCRNRPGNRDDAGDVGGDAAGQRRHGAAAEGEDAAEQQGQVPSLGRHLAPLRRIASTGGSSTPNPFVFRRRPAIMEGRQSVGPCEPIVASLSWRSDHLTEPDC